MHRFIVLFPNSMLIAEVVWYCHQPVLISNFINLDYQKAVSVHLCAKCFAPSPAGEQAEIGSSSSPLAAAGQSGGSAQGFSWAGEEFL